MLSSQLLRSRIFGFLPLRFLVPVSIVVFLRLLLAVALSLTLTPATAIHSTLRNEFFMFAGWDSEHYDGIVQTWYPNTPSRPWEFFPLYPALARLLTLVGVQAFIAELLVSTVTGLVSVVVFQKIAEHYLTPGLSLAATLAYFLLPPVFVFNAVSYSEPVFLLFSLLCWYYFLEEKDWKSSLFAGLNSLVRAYGILIVLPLACGYLKKRQYKKLAYCTSPVLALVGWMLYSFLKTGFVAPIYAEGTFLMMRSGYFPILQETVAGVLHGHLGFRGLIDYVFQYFPFAIVSIASLALVTGLAFRTFHLDRLLGIYALASISAIFCFGLPASVISFPRYFAYVFPIGLTLGTKRKSVLLVSLLILAALDYVAWNVFLTSLFF